MRLQDLSLESLGSSTFDTGTEHIVFTPLHVKAYFKNVLEDT